jgi:ribosomal protein S18 acetylase RimI-like enzyme
MDRVYFDRLEESLNRSSELVQTLSDEEWAKKMPGGWSIAAECTHMLASIKPISLALLLPKTCFRVFGRPNRLPRTYDDLVSRYQEKVRTLKNPPSSFDPQKKKVLGREQWLQNWEKTSTKLIGTWRKWTPNDLKGYLSPHPLLGKIHFLELLYFTIYHNELHRRNLELKKQWLGFRLEQVKTEDAIVSLSQLAAEIWNEHYPSIIGQDQVDYMMDKFQSAAHIRRQIETESYDYYLLKRLKEPLGYLAVQPTAEGLFISKVYLHKDVRGLGLGKLMHWITRDMGRSRGLEQLWLTVNKENHIAIRAYEAWGYVRAEELVMDIGGGYVMDDYKYIYSL